jgi:hypothetical protein
MHALFSTGNVSADPYCGPARLPDIVNAVAAIFADLTRRNPESAAFCRPSIPRLETEYAVGAAPRLDVQASNVVAGSDETMRFGPGLFA